jgi:bifunctional diaminopimelate decarboxylase / aspartate kinase
MQQVVTKFGGTSVSSRETWDKIAAITQNHIGQKKQAIIVCSALSQVSNLLEKLLQAALLNEHSAIEADIKTRYIHLANELEVDPKLIETDFEQLHQLSTGIALLKEAPAKTKAIVLSLGELMMTKLGAAFLEQQGISCEWLDAREALVSTSLPGGDNINYLSAQCDCQPQPKLAKRLQQSRAQAVITQGFIASNPAGETVLLGRGGSDTSAALFAALLQASSCEIWTDVPGIYTANPHQLPHARLLKQLNYFEAQEIASMGAKVLHPNCLPPLRRAGIPLAVKYTRMPEHSGTTISKESDPKAPPIKSIQVKHHVTLISIDTLNMWQQVGFLADVFATFKQHGFSVDLLSSSEFNVTVSLDANAKLRDKQALNQLIEGLNQFGRATIIEPCSAVSLVGQHIRTVLPQLGPTLELFEAQQIYLMSLASNDLNLTFVVDASQADKLCQKLHALLIENNTQSFYYSKSWHDEFGAQTEEVKPWWEDDRDRLLDIGSRQSPCYVYHSKVQTEQAKKLKQISAIDRLFYAIKANSHPSVLNTLFEQGVCFECVSIQELKHVQKHLPNIKPEQLLFTPNFCGKEEYAYALSLGCNVTIDNMYPLQAWPELFKHQSILLRIDPGSGAGHHKYVCTGGDESKFGIPRADLEQVADIASRHDIKIVGLHAHSGSGILLPDLWKDTALMLAEEAKRFKDVTILNLGGGLGIVEKPAQQPLDISALNESLQAVKSSYPRFEFWLEPGRYLVAESGVILAKVTQLKEKGNVRFIGIDTGMNSLIRPALYGAYHEIVNLTRLNDESSVFAHIVGPICESGDTLGYDRLMPVTQEHDVILIANTGAYGHCMGSHYNLRPPAEEVIL